MARKREFVLGVFDSGSKEVNLWGPGELSAMIDYDDVDQSAVRRAAKKMVRILNAHWNDEVK